MSIDVDIGTKNFDIFVWGETPYHETYIHSNRIRHMTARRTLLRMVMGLSVLAIFSTTVPAQTYDVLERVKADRNKAAGCEGPYRFDAAPLTAAPKDYAPFYISHYGRHGSRYAWNPGTYTVIKNVLDAAAKANSLTPYGKQLYGDYLGFYEVPSINAGDLSDLGWEQHSEIARIMCQEFPQVFKDGGEILARASTSQRAIVSMNAFTVSLQRFAPKVNVEMNSLHTNMTVTNAASAPRDLQTRYEGRLVPTESLSDFKARKIDFDGILDKLFSDRGFLEEIGGRTQFISELFALWAGYHNYSDGNWMEDLFTEEQILALWEIENYSCYLDHSGQRYTQISLLDDIISCADEAIATGKYKGHFRFGHDTVFNAICPLLNINGTGYMPSSSDDVKYWFQNYDTPMAANLQFVLYKSKKNPEILFKLLRNGQEVTLPQLNAVSGPYYKWSDFKDWADNLKKEHPVMRNPAPASQSPQTPQMPQGRPAGR